MYAAPQVSPVWWLYLLNAQAVLQLSFSDQIYSGVQRPLVLASEDDVGSIEPGHSGHFVVYVTPAGRREFFCYYVTEETGCMTLRGNMTTTSNSRPSWKSLILLTSQDFLKLVNSIR